MISLFISIIAVVAWFAGAMCCAMRFIDNGARDHKAWAYLFVLVWCLAWAMNEDAKREAQHPCAAYETRMTYNPAIKAMAPMRVCVERGEWVE